MNQHHGIMRVMIPLRTHGHYHNRECQTGFHVWNPNPRRGTRCLCGKMVFGTKLERGFIKVRREGEVGRDS